MYDDDLCVFTDDVYFDFADEDLFVILLSTDFKDDEKSSSHDSILMKNRKNVLLEVNMRPLYKNADDADDNIMMMI